MKFGYDSQFDWACLPCLSTFTMSRYQSKPKVKDGGTERKKQLLVPKGYAGKNQAQWVRHDFIYDIDFFKDCELLFLDRVAEGLDTRLYLPDEVIIQEDTEGTSMSILHRGTVQVSAKGHNIAELRDGSYFGEIAVLGISAHRTASVTAVTICDVRTLPRSHFIRALREFPGEQERFNALAKVRAAVTVGAKLQQAQAEEKRRLQERKKIAMDRARMFGGLKLSLYVGAADKEVQDDDSDADSVDVKMRRLSTGSNVIASRMKGSRSLGMKASRKAKVKAVKAEMNSSSPPDSPARGSLKSRESPDFSLDDSTPRSTPWAKRRESQQLTKRKIAVTVSQSTQLKKSSLTVATRVTNPDRVKPECATEALDWFASNASVTKAPRHKRFLKAVQSLGRELWRLGSRPRTPWDPILSRQEKKSEERFDSMATMELEPSVASSALAQWDLQMTRLRQEELNKEEEVFISVLGENYATQILREVDDQEEKRKTRTSLHSSLRTSVQKGSSSPSHGSTGKGEDNEPQEQVFHGSLSHAVSGSPVGLILAEEMPMKSLASKSNAPQSPVSPLSVRKRSHSPPSSSLVDSPYAVSRRNHSPVSK